MTYRPLTPDQTDVTDALLHDLSLRMEGPGPGRVESYDPATETATITPLLRLPVPQGDGSNEFEAADPVPCVRVIFPRGGPFAVTWNPEQGDLVLLIPCGGDIGTWWAGSGDVTTPVDTRRHHLAHVVAIPGLFNKSRALQNHSGNFRIGLDTADASGTIEIESDGTVVLSGGTLRVARVTDPVNVCTVSGFSGPYVSNFVVTPTEADGTPGAPAPPSTTGVINGFVSSEPGSGAEKVLA